jgi:hypothetical protein
MTNLKYFFGAAFILMAPLPVAANDAQRPLIDLSTQNEHQIVEEEYQSVRPGAMDEKFAPTNPLGDTEINLSYGEEEQVEDEYGIVREQPTNLPGQTANDLAPTE